MLFKQLPSLRWLLTGVFILAWTGWIVAGAPAVAAPAAEEPQAIVLLYFQGFGLDNAVLLQWATASEFNTAGFRLERAPASGSPYLPLDNIGFIPGEGDGITGAEYEVTDDTAMNGVTYWYKLIEIENDGDENPVDPIPVTAGPTTPTPTATATRTPTPQPGQTGTPTPSATSPAGATSTTTPSATAATGGNSQLPTSTPAAGQTATNTSQPPTPAGALPIATTRPPASSNPTAASQGVAQIPSATPAGDASPPPPVTPGVVTPAGSPGYPAGDQTEPADLAASPYPGGTNSPDNANVDSTPQPIPVQQSTQPAAIGDDSAPEGQNQQSEEAAGRSSTLILWGGFIAALLVFGAGVLGAILLFSRPVNKER
ncbi:MAG: hypothetical protein L0332_26220 [Chloroflexi bacterium]|nr:hypothetical protein [Chloroflexota bacterium]MCI0580028.1 hypothetical protein [Chloroflexota bacterium]MCI0646777.1 hypothetical protein [Chloroflexota bacterium]MCI0730195.1 hypothetical protein [Chloroflexota bacterium]